MPPELKARVEQWMKLVKGNYWHIALTHAQQIIPDLLAENERLEAVMQAQSQTTVAVLAQVECGCGDIRPSGEMCHICGHCQIGCCMCAEKLADAQARIAELEAEGKDWRDNHLSL